MEKGVHIIRRTFANRLSELGVDLMDIQDLMRHSDPSTTRIYTKEVKNGYSIKIIIIFTNKNLNI